MTFDNVVKFWYSIPSIFLRPELWYRHFHNKWLKEQGEVSIEIKCARMLTGKDE